jgi:hypothetical protein
LADKPVSTYPVLGILLVYLVLANVTAIESSGVSAVQGFIKHVPIEVCVPCREAERVLG